MNFSKLKLVSEMYVQQPGGGAGSLAGTKLSQAANNKASEQAQAPKKVTNTSNNIGMQAKQMSQKTGNIQSPNVQKPGGAPAKAATTGGQMATVENYFNALRSRKEYNKLVEKEKSDWKSELKEALGADDEVFHPYVEVMPFKDFKQNEAKKNLAKQAMEPGAAENPAQKKVKKDMMTAVMGEETLIEGKKPKKGQAKKGEKIGPKKTTPKNAADALRMNPKLKSKMRKAEKEFTKSDNDSRRYAKEALKHHKDQIRYKKQGKDDKAIASAKKGSIAAHKAQAARAAGMKYIPVGSRTYSKAGNPAAMNDKFARDSKSSSGRKEILIRSVYEGNVTGPFTQGEMDMAHEMNRRSKKTDAQMNLALANQREYMRQLDAKNKAKGLPEPPQPRTKRDDGKYKSNDLTNLYGKFKIAKEMGDKETTARLKKKIVDIEVENRIRDHLQSGTVGARGLTIRPLATMGVRHSDEGQLHDKYKDQGYLDFKSKL